MKNGSKKGIWGEETTKDEVTGSREVLLIVPFEFREELRPREGDNRRNGVGKVFGMRTRCVLVTGRSVVVGENHRGNRRAEEGRSGRW